MISALAHKITACFFVILLFAQNISTLVIIGDFAMNQERIAKTLCVEKDNQKGCLGKCHLSEILKKAESDSKTPLPVKEIKRFSLDAFCFYKIHSTDNETPLFIENLIGFNKKSEAITSTYFDIETPPPNRR